MERRKRVELIMGSRAFKDELERIVEVQLRDGGVNPSSLLALQQLYDAQAKFGGQARGMLDISLSMSPPFYLFLSK